MEIITDQTFDSIVEQAAEKFILIFFTHSNCRVCVKYENELKKMIQDQNTSGVAIYKVDCLYERNLKGRFDIDYFPFIILVKNKRFIPYLGQATTEQFNKFITYHKSTNLFIQLENMKPIPGQLEILPFLTNQIIKRMNQIIHILNNKIFLKPSYYLIPFVFLLISSYLTYVIEDYLKQQQINQ